MLIKLFRFLRWKKQKNQFGFLGENFCVGKDFVFTGSKNICVGDNFYAEERLRLQTWAQYRDKETGYIPRLQIGKNVSMMSGCHISCANSITIGDGCLFGDNVFVTDNLHGTGSMEESCIPPIERPLHIKREVVIGRNVWVGRNVCIMPGVTIGDAAVIGANAVVTKDIPSGSIAVGVPAKVIR